MPYKTPASQVFNRKPSLITIFKAIAGYGIPKTPRSSEDCTSGFSFVFTEILLVTWLDRLEFHFSSFAKRLENVVNAG